MTVTSENISLEQVVVLIHQNALEEMDLREERILRQIRRLQDDLSELRKAKATKRFETQSLRDMFLSRGCV